MHPLCRQRTTGEETLVCLHENRVSAIARASALSPGEPRLRAPRCFRQHVRSFGRCSSSRASRSSAPSMRRRTSCSTRTMPPATSSPSGASTRRRSRSPDSRRSSGPTGTVVTITGTGFGATATANAVTFNGVAATVVAATATTLTVAVPAGAATGKIAVTVAGNTATSAQDFVVAAPGVPTIGGFTPAAGPAGTAVTVTGTNFNAAPGATTVKLNQNAATAIVGHDDAARVRRSGRHRLRQDPHRDQRGQRRQRRGFRRAARDDCRERHHRHDAGSSRTAPRKASASMPPASTERSCSTATRATGSAFSSAISRSIRRGRRLPTRSTSRTTRSSRAARCRRRISRSICRRCRWPAPTRCCSARASRRFRSTRGSRATPSSRPTGRRGRRAERRAIHAGADRGGGRRAESVDGVGLGHRSRRRQSRLDDRAAERLHVPPGQRNRAGLHDAAAAVHGDGHACGGLHGERRNDADRVQGRIRCGRRRCRSTARRVDLAIAESRRRRAPHVCRCRRRESGARHHGARPQPRVGYVRERLGVQAGCRVAGVDQLPRRRHAVRGQSAESSRHRHLQRHRAAGERRDGITAGVALARCRRDAWQAARRSAWRWRVPARMRGSTFAGHGRRADRAPGARRRDEPARRRGFSSSSASPMARG